MCQARLTRCFSAEHFIARVSGKLTSFTHHQKISAKFNDYSTVYKSTMMNSFKQVYSITFTDHSLDLIRTTPDY